MVRRWSVRGSVATRYDRNRPAPFPLVSGRRNSLTSTSGTPSQGGDTGSNPVGTTQVSGYIDCDKRLVISQISATTARRALGGT
jgi:hypothetical protein